MRCCCCLSASKWRADEQPSSVTYQCQCGCTVTDSIGYIIASARQRCHTTIRRWTIHVKPQHTISLTIDYFILSQLSSVRVYDSAKSTADGNHLPLLLLKLTNNGEDEYAAKTLVTSGNRMLIEYIIMDNDMSAVRNNEGFIASYIATREFTGIALH